MFIKDLFSSRKIVLPEHVRNNKEKLVAIPFTRVLLRILVEEIFLILNISGEYVFNWDESIVVIFKEKGKLYKFNINDGARLCDFLKCKMKRRNSPITSELLSKMQMKIMEDVENKFGPVFR